MLRIETGIIGKGFHLYAGEVFLCNITEEKARELASSGVEIANWEQVELYFTKCEEIKKAQGEALIENSEYFQNVKAREERERKIASLNESLKGLI